MPRDAARGAEAKGWIRKAGIDIGTARHVLTTAPQFVTNAVFLCQQAVEKSLKGFLVWNEVSFAKTHDLSKLGRQCVALDSTLEEICRRAERLTVFAWMFRYPGEPEEPTIEDARETLRIAQETYDAVVERLPIDARP